MNELQSLIRLQTWLSPAFPTGAFSYSHGLESAIGHGNITSSDDLSDWINEILTNGPGWNDAVLLAEAWRTSNCDELSELAELASSISFSKPRHLETTAQGAAFVLASKTWCDVALPKDCPLPIAVGAVAGSLEIELKATLAAYLHAYVSNQIQAALRLMRLGQQGGVELLASLEVRVVETAQRASISSLDDLGSNTVMADIIAMQHETLPSRIFRS